MLTQGNIEEEIIRLSDDESYYADNEYITNSMLSKLNKSPLELYAYMNGELDTNTQALNFGKAFHTAILEPEKMENIAVFDGKRKVGKAWDVFHAENHDKIILTQDEMTTLESMFARLSSNPMACEHMMLDDKSTQTEIVNILIPLLFAGLVIEGGIVGYDSNIQSGGVGARYFGLGVNEQYRVDQVTVSMRIVSVQTGEVLLSTNVTKTIASHASGGDVFRFLDMGTKALELETGVAVNEPVNYAIRTAIEFAVLQLIYAGEKQEFWKFKNPNVDIHPHKKTNTEINGVHK